MEINTNENTSAEMVDETTIPKENLLPSHLKTSRQKSIWTRWFSNKDKSNLSSKETIATSSCICPPTSECGNSTSSCQCAHNHNRHTPDRNFEDQNSSTTTPNYSDQQDMIQEKQARSSPCTPTNTKLEERKSENRVKMSKTTQSPSKMAVLTVNYSSASSLIDQQQPSSNKMSRICRLLCPCYFIMSKQNTTIENSTQVTNNQENHEYSDSGVNHDSAQKLSEVSNNNDIDIHNIVSDETTHIETPQLDVIETKEEEDTNMLCSVSIHADSSLSNKQDDDHSIIMIEAETNSSIKAGSIVAQHEQSDKLNSDTVENAIKKQQELKAYYGGFPNIDDAMDAMGPDVQKAKEFTKSILGELPSGDVSDRNTACHVLNKLFRNDQQECLFYNSNDGINLHDSFQNVADTDSQDRPFVLKLSNSKGLGNIKHSTTEQEDLELVQVLNNAIEQKQSHAVIDDIIERLANVHGVKKEDIVIKTVFNGTLNIVYTVKDSLENKTLVAGELISKLKNQFEEFVNAKIHPLLHRPTFNIAYFDTRGNKCFPNISETFEVGPSERKKMYTTPAGWTRYGLKVLDKYESKYWLDPFQHEQNWYRAFHGTGNAQKLDFTDGNQPSDQQFACVDALASIYSTGFCEARVHAYGPGVYCSPNPQFSERGYVRPVSLDTQQGTKSFKCMLQVAVNPDGVKFSSDKDIWVVLYPKDIRPYGILIKEA